MLKLVALVFVGGGLGSVARLAVARFLAQAAAPFLSIATLSVNVLGSFLIGLFWAIPAIAGKNDYIHLLTIGFCGGFTTFSAFSWESFNLLKQGDVFLFFLYAFLNIGLCLFAVWGGYTLGKATCF